MLGNANGVFKVRTVKRRSPSQQWNASYVIQMTSTPWQPRGDGVESTAFVMPPDLGVKGRVRPPPGLERVEEEAEGNVELEDMVPGQSESVTEQDLLLQDGNDRASAEMDHEAPEATGESPRKSARIDPDAPATEPSTKQMRISAVHHMIAGVIPACKWLASIVGVDEVVGKDGTKIEVEVNAEEGELDQEMRLSEPLLWESEFPPEAERRGMMKEMDSMKNFGVYDEVKVDDCTQEQIDGALDCRWVKVWKSEDELRCRVVVRGCFQNVEKSEEDNLFASMPSLVTMRLLLCMALARNWGITMGDVSTAFLHALMNEEVVVWPPKEFYLEGKCLWRLKKAMYGLRQAPKLEHFAEVMTTKLGFRRCKSDPNLYCHESGRLYVLAYVDDLLVVGTDEMRKSFMSQLSEEVLLKETGQLVPGSEHTFLGRRLRHNGDSIDVCMSQKYIDTILDLYGMKDAKPVATTGTVTINKTVPDTPLSPEEHKVYRTAVGKLLWLALVRGDIAYATKELSRDVTAPTMQSAAKCKHLLRYLIGTRMCVLRLRPSYQLANGNCAVDINVYVDTDWAGCSKTRKSTSGSTVNVLGCNVVSTARTQGTLALSSGEAELYAIGQGVSEALFVRSMLLESKLAKKVNVIAHTDSTAGKSMATRFGTGKKTKHVELRFLYVQNLVQMGLLRMAKIEGTRNPADLMTKYVATDVLQRLKAHIGVVSNWFKGLTTDAHDTDDHVAPVVNAQWPPPPQPPPECPFPARPRVRPECTHCAHCFSGRRWTEVHAEGLRR